MTCFQSGEEQYSQWKLVGSTYELVSYNASGCTSAPNQPDQEHTKDACKYGGTVMDATYYNGINGRDNSINNGATYYTKWSAATVTSARVVQSYTSSACTDIS